MSSSEGDEDFIKYGTPLEPLEEDEIPRKRPCYLEDQVATDKHGRRRFHGAFTGGFSAGFFNTVGSIEGWKPSSFKSSKSEKQIISRQKPEDYMDDEDTNEFGIAPVVLRTRETYTSSSAQSFHNQDIGRFLFTSLLKPVRETIGIKLLGKMGWKPGQGIGPRTRKSEKKKLIKLRKKVYGCKLLDEPEEDEEENEKCPDSDSDSEWSNVTFAPSDYEPFIISPKDNFFGIGYQGLSKQKILGFSKNRNDHSNFVMEKGGKKVNIRGQAFGVGAFEEEDEDIYSREDLSQYDYMLPGDKDEENDENKGKKPGIKFAMQILDGFTPQSKKRLNIHYPLPLVPKNFKCRHKFRKTRFDDIETEKIPLLLEPPNLSKPATKLTSETKQCDSNVASSITVQSNSVTTHQCNFKPFSYDPAKQERFENYLKQDTEKRKEDLSSMQGLVMTDWSKEKERLEFDQAAKLLRPLTETLQSRFLPAKQADDVSDPLAVVERFLDDDEEWHKAAKMKMYGQMTRRVDEWAPCSLLSKRFNVPEVKKRFDEDRKKKESQPKSIFTYEMSVELNESEKKSERKEKETNEIQIHAKNNNISSEKVNENDSKNENSKIDLFKAIFLDSEDDDEDDKEENKISSGQIQFEENLINHKRNDSPPRGIFENIDLKVFGEDEQPKTNDNEQLVKNCTSLRGSTFDLDSNEIYGPKIPETISTKHHDENKTWSALAESADELQWVEKEVDHHMHKKKRKKEKRSKKHSKTSHKGKHKKKEHKK